MRAMNQIVATNHSTIFNNGQKLIPVQEISATVCRNIDFIFTDIDDTLTVSGRIPASTYVALWQARNAGIQVVPITGRPAGWCDHLARMWPVAAVVGENGALAFSMQEHRIQRLYAPRLNDAAKKLENIRQEILESVPGCKVAADQAYREYDLAIDISEEVLPLDNQAIDAIVAIFEKYGATAKVSSIHINGYFGDYDKLTMCKRCVAELLDGELDPERATFLGDSPNDEPMFGYFPYAIGVANVRKWVHRMSALPTYVTEAEGGEGFAEFIRILLSRR